MAGSSSLQGSPPLPIEIWLLILGQAAKLADLANFARVNEHFWNTTIPLLYGRAASSSPHTQQRALFWGVVHDLPRTLESALAAGINIDSIWHSPRRASKFPSFSDILAGHTFSRSLEGEGSEDEGEIDMGEYHDWHWSVVHIAVARGNIPILERLLRENPRLDTGCLGLCDCEVQPQILGPRTAATCGLQIPMWTPLHLAICSGQVRVAELLLSAGASEYMDQPQGGTDLIRTGLTPLHVACMSGQTSMVEWLIQTRGYHSRIDVLDAACQSPLVYAYLYRHWDSFQAMLNHGADINVVVTDNLSSMARHNPGGQDEEENLVHQTMLYSSIQDHRFEDACHLIAFGANLHLPRDPDNLPLINLLCESPWDVRPWFAWQINEYKSHMQDMHGSVLLDVLINSRLNSRLEFNESFLGTTALAHAAHSANPRAVHRLLLAGANANEEEWGDSPPLLMAIENPHQRSILGVVTMLLDSGAASHYDTANHEPPLWSLYVHNKDRPEVEPIAELLLQRGAKPVRGTATGDSKYTTPLEKFLADGDVTAFETLRARCPNAVFGEDDVIGIWRSVSKRSEAKLIEYVLDMDGCEAVLQKHDVIYLPVPRLSVQIPTPFDLVLKLLNLQTGSRSIQGYLGGIINRAIVQNVDPLLVKELLDAGASCRHMYKFRTPLMEVLGKHGKPMELRKEYIRVLLGAGDRIYRDLGMYYSPHLRPQEDPNTILGFALNEVTKDARVLTLIELMLELQPLRNEPSAQTYVYVRQTCLMGRMRALMAVIGSSDIAVSTIRSNASKLIHEMLDTIPSQQKTIGDLNDTIDCLEFIIIQDGDCLRSIVPGVSSDTRTAKEKLLALIWSNTSSDNQMAGATWCMRNRIMYTAEDKAPDFVQLQWPSSFGTFKGDHTSLAEVGKLIQKSKV
ncbi:unnamed protein product [Clonostachys byssicola]|uniref:Ankyrin repeat protein n=1 Tax=Clonostachys byssicola TaxID=160290 RepID=A0A9N9XZQ3_9HYPO|nr:unnamed protein product [Clonostachys byssicola]